MADKILWHGTFNWQGQNIEHYTHAQTEHVAFCNICKKIAMEVQTSFNRIYYYFSDQKGYKYILTKTREELQ
jgi:hypothetical protein